MTQWNHIRNQTPRWLTQPLKLDMCLLHYPLHHNDLSKVPHEIFRNIPLDTSMFASKYSLVHHRTCPSRWPQALQTFSQVKASQLLHDFFKPAPLKPPSNMSAFTMEMDYTWTTKSSNFLLRKPSQDLGNARTQNQPYLSNEILDFTHGSSLLSWTCTHPSHQISTSNPLNHCPYI